MDPARLDQARIAFEQLHEGDSWEAREPHLARARRAVERLSEAVATASPEGELLRFTAIALETAEQAVAGLAAERSGREGRRRTAERLSNSLRLDAVSRLAGGVAHELNNALMVIQNYALFIAEESPPGSQARADAAEIEAAVAGVGRLTSQLLAFGRRESGTRDRLDLAAALSDLEPRLRQELPEGVRLDLDLAPGLPTVDAEPRRLEDIVLNLVRNAGEAIEDTGTISIEVTARDVDDAFAADHPQLLAGPHLALRVIDDGVGMDRAMLDRIFDPFFTTHAQEDHGGLGLAIVHGLVEAWGGAVEVQSEIGEGTVITVLLPASVAELEVGGTPDEPLPDPGPGRFRVLLCEDDKAVRSLCARVLERAGYEVLTAADGAEGLRVLAGEADEGRSLDLLLSDVVMPRVPGFEVALAARERFPGIPIALMSGYSHDLVLGDGLAMLGEPISSIEKPISGSELLARVQELVGSPPVERAEARSPD